MTTLGPMTKAATTPATRTTGADGPVSHQLWTGSRAVSLQRK